MIKNKKFIISAISLALVLCFALGATFAYLISKPASVKNVFTVGNVDIELKEVTPLSNKMVANETIASDPYVLVKKGSEESYVFIKIVKSNNFDDFLTFTVDTAWTQLKVDGKDVPGVYYYNTAYTEDKELYILKDNKYTVKNITKTMADALTEDTMPDVTYYAGAIQKSGFKTVEEAWAQLGDLASAG